jgi:hypothetical protein
MVNTSVYALQPYRSFFKWNIIQFLLLRMFKICLFAKYQLSSVFQRLALKWSSVNFSILSYVLNYSFKGSFLDRILHNQAGRLRPNLKCQIFIMLMSNMFSHICTILYKRCLLMKRRVSVLIIRTGM